MRTLQVTATVIALSISLIGLAAWIFNPIGDRSYYVLFPCGAHEFFTCELSMFPASHQGPVIGSAVTLGIYVGLVPFMAFLLGGLLAYIGHSAIITPLIMAVIKSVTGNDDGDYSYVDSEYGGIYEPISTDNKKHSHGIQDRASPQKDDFKVAGRSIKLAFVSFAVVFLFVFTFVITSDLLLFSISWFANIYDIFPILAFLAFLIAVILAIAPSTTVSQWVLRRFS